IRFEKWPRTPRRASGSSEEWPDERWPSGSRSRAGGRRQARHQASCWSGEQGEDRRGRTESSNEGGVRGIYRQRYYGYKGIPTAVAGQTISSTRLETAEPGGRATTVEELYGRSRAVAMVVGMPYGRSRSGQVVGSFGNIGKSVRTIWGSDRRTISAYALVARWGIIQHEFGRV
ncbi:hypothetical protein Dimus_032299, partial [Dionaea muscipula]